MAYSTTQREARYKIREGQEGTIITRWYRNVERDNEGNPTGVVVFEGLCEEDNGEGRCKLVMVPGTDGDSTLVLKYTCKSVNCDAEGGCVLQYSWDDDEYFDVTADEPPPEQNCYFRCRCGTG